MFQDYRSQSSSELTKNLIQTPANPKLSKISKDLLKQLSKAGWENYFLMQALNTGMETHGVIGSPAIFMSLQNIFKLALLVWIADSANLLIFYLFSIIFAIDHSDIDFDTGSVSI